MGFLWLKKDHALEARNNLLISLLEVCSSREILNARVVSSSFLFNQHYLQNMKYLGGTVLASFLLLLLFVAMPVSAQTETTTAALTSQLQALLKQVSDLQAQIQTLNQQSAQLTKDIVATRSALTKNLREGATDEEVKLLQELLAQDLTIYPEGLITGYYGALTAKAVRKFQERYNIEPVGEVGPRTLSKINELVSEGAWKVNNLPPGIAKHFTGSSIPENLPPGIYKKWIDDFWGRKVDDDDGDGDDDGEDKDDGPSTLAIEDLRVKESSGYKKGTTARIIWHTDVKSRGTLYYGTDSPIDLSATNTLVKRSALRKSHDIRLGDLVSGETYYFVIVASDGDYEVKSSEHSFTMDGEEEELDDNDDADQDTDSDEDDEDD